MRVTDDPANPWYGCTVYKFQHGDLEVAIVRGEAGQRRWYTELHRYDQYVSSRGSDTFFGFMAVLAHIMADCPKELGGYRCKHGLHNGVVECGEGDLDDEDL